MKLHKAALAGAAILLMSFQAGCALTEQYEVLKTEFLGKAEDAKPKPKPKAKQKQKQARENGLSPETEQEALETEEPSSVQQDGEEQKPLGDQEIHAEDYAFLTLTQEEQTVYQEVLKTALEHTENTEVSKLDTEVLERAYRAVCADYGGLFWMSGYVYTQYTRGGELTGMEFTPKYIMDYEERQRFQQQIDGSVEELLAGISITDTDYEKAKYVFEILAQNVDYDSSVEHNQNIISAFLNRATVCQGYASAAQYLLKQLGIQSVIVTGRANGESHAWNLICLDGAYYYMDTTWGNSRYLDHSSQSGKHVNYSYMAMTTEEIERTHTFDNSFPLPVCSSMACNYFVRENRYFTDWNPQAVGTLLAEVWNGGGEELAVKFSSQDIYRMAMDYFITEQHISDYCENISSIYYLEDEERYVLTFHFSSS